MTMATSESTTPESLDVQIPATVHDVRLPEKFKERVLTIGDCSIESSSDSTTYMSRESLLKAPSLAPFLRLKGRWLEQAGFPIGGKVRVSVTSGRLVIEPMPVIPERVPHLPRRAEKLFF
jgi:Toxin SymE, type I toxin-antitoxin system